nr:hypothetical protein CFP56_07906 [Quercus suber]
MFWCQYTRPRRLLQQGFALLWNHGKSRSGEPGLLIPEQSLIWGQHPWSADGTRRTWSAVPPSMPCLPAAFRETCAKGLTEKFRSCARRPGGFRRNTAAGRCNGPAARAGKGSWRCGTGGISSALQLTLNEDSGTIPAGRAYFAECQGRASPSTYAYDSPWWDRVASLANIVTLFDEVRETEPVFDVSFDGTVTWSSSCVFLAQRVFYLQDGHTSRCPMERRRALSERGIARLPITWSGLRLPAKSGWSLTVLLDSHEVSMTTSLEIPCMQILPCNWHFNRAANETARLGRAPSRAPFTTSRSYWILSNELSSRLDGYPGKPSRCLVMLALGGNDQKPYSKP